MPEIPKLEECTLVVVCGPVASGKSWLLEEWFNMMERTIFIDSTAALFDDSYEHIFANPSQVCWRLQKNPYYYRIAYHPADIFGAFHWCATAIWQFSQSRWLIIDEVHEVCGVSGVEPMMKKILRYARHNFLGMVGASQRLADVSRLLTSGARMVVLFYTEEARDLDAIADRWGNAVADAVTRLRPCIYDDANKICYQHPECLVIKRGIGYKVFALGDKIDDRQLTRGENEQWEPIGQATQTSQPSPSLDSTSGQSEENSTEYSSNHETQTLE